MVEHIAGDPIIEDLESYQTSSKVVDDLDKIIVYSVLLYD